MRSPVKWSGALLTRPSIATTGTLSLPISPKASILFWPATCQMINLSWIIPYHPYRYIPVLLPKPSSCEYGSIITSFKLETRVLRPEPHTIPTRGCCRRGSVTKREMVARVCAKGSAGVADGDMIRRNYICKMRRNSNGHRTYNKWKVKT